MNKVFLTGNITKDPELRKTSGDVSVCTFTIAVNRRKTADGQRKADFFNIVAWRGLADICYQYTRKGSKVTVVGSLQNRSYEKDGQERWITEVQADEVEFLTSKQSDMTPVDEEPLPWE